MTDFIKLVNGRQTRTVAVQASSGAPDANRLVATASDGRLDPTVMPTGIGQDAKTMTASEAIAARDLVNVAATGTIRKADGSNDRPAMGFVLAAIANAASGTVFFEGTITGLTGLTQGSRYFLSDTVAGQATLTPATAGAGKISQEIGFAISATEITFEPQTAVLLG